MWTDSWCSITTRPGCIVNFRRAWWILFSSVCVTRLCAVYNLFIQICIIFSPSFSNKQWKIQTADQLETIVFRVRKQWDCLCLVSLAWWKQWSATVCILYWPSLKYQILPSEKFSVSLKFKISLAQLKRRISRVPNLIPILVD